MTKEPLVLPIKRRWFDMILSGEKKEEYRDIKLYQIRGTPSSVALKLRAGYAASCPTCLVRGRLTIKEGRSEWGAEPGKEYYTVCIDEVCTR